MSIFSGLAGLIGYVRDSGGNSWYKIDNGTTNFLGTANNLEIVLDNSVLSSLVQIRMDALSKVRFYVQVGDKRVYDHPLLEIIKNPNVHQSTEDFLKQYELYRLAYGWVYQRPYKAVGFDASSIFNLDPTQIQFPKELGNTLVWKTADKRNYYRQEFAYKDRKTKYSMKFEDIIPFYDISNSIGTGKYSAVTSPSRVQGIIKEASNIGLANDAENKIIQTNGREMLVQKTNSKEGFGNLGLDAGDKKNVLEQLNKNHNIRNGNRTIVPNIPLDWVNMTIPLKALGFKESKETNANVVAQAFGVPNEVYKAFTTGATFENQKQAQLGFYQNTMQPVADDLASSWTASFGDKNTPFGASFDHLPTMSIVEEMRADRALKLSVTIRNLTQSGLTTDQAEAYLTTLGIITDGN